MLPMMRGMSTKPVPFMAVLLLFLSMNMAIRIYAVTPMEHLFVRKVCACIPPFNLIIPMDIALNVLSVLF